ncbi:3'(2'),5'-bisphosphate nucleotidase CysQ [Methylobacterium sp. Leaf399]|uniref:3'(2'),5'-bisphosphate nucleotidase CysQ family protein n=1 Tax=unclassified Methylobacterium TaxID=2615210 RepID=UPI0006F5B0BC|nr:MULTISPECIES: 3'(2'),5'-bisphosphate nucleotidase CysQ [unclassified Methylobacterium]KQP52573.1 3'(2'),5'-bisphosphate nucleotidase CysQ [Methylobacterium sp. Leaf108]KQT11753.1 3'(2'),5'-bisphosphate nucleotidase CysQ [Methylobacterium sp. Leaf399]
MTLLAQDRARIATTLTEIACEAGEILRAYHGGDCPHVIKPDGSPASSADIESEALIVAALARHWPGIPVVAEESSHDRPPADLFFLVDPLDGTSDFLAGNREYTVNIGLVQGDRPVAAALAAPGLGRVWGAGVEAFEAPIVCGRPGAPSAVGVRRQPDDGLVALVSRRHGDIETEACLARLPVGRRLQAASALKFCLIASGEADIYVRCGPTMEWDTAAGDHVLTSAGGRVLVSSGEAITYGHYDLYYRNGPFVAVAQASYADRLSLPHRARPVRPGAAVSPKA